MTADGTAGHTVAVLAYDGMTGYESGIVTEVFGLRWPDIDVPWYDLKICTERPEPVRVIGGATLSTPHGLEELAEAQTVVIPSVRDPRTAPSPRVVAVLRKAHEAGARIVSICTGAFPVAEAGLLDGRVATTHWRYADLLRARYPSVEVDPAPLYVDSGDVLTSAGCSAGMDLCLHLVRKDHGAAIANAVARRLVVPPHREGGQAQFVEAPIGVDPEDDRISRSMAWALENLNQPITLDQLAARATMSARSYLRHFTRATGTTPVRWLIAQRVQASLPLLETTSASVEEIATAVGFDTAVTFRHHFVRAMGLAPSAYRRSFHAGEAVAAHAAAR
ncbi:helix-turn-helix domain-containing protein [Streptoalloteichus hindustanus]|uniref:Transcriptional regulator, AraC family with amidase-like domain n=1 Tax=Streptoalloteichus hindustanus TaxID=2017 RepID=A0A1M4XQD3_STRHI|nr:helix-turn-helix domain-containing protein [Streptoalloteichus hindustanus]SHE95709.1 transcriptional regulator, AraC family with amidase-like domain [Streptoalloteichus hindustanus]